MTLEEYNTHIKALDAVKEALTQQYANEHTTLRAGDTVRWVERCAMCGDAEFREYVREITGFIVDFTGAIHIMSRGLAYYPRVDEVTLMDEKDIEK
jgi:hypothetical protein